MPIYEYRVKDGEKGCAHCAGPFSVLQRLSDPRLEKCPVCGAAVARLISAPAVGRSASGFDGRAKAAGFHKLKRLGKGEYEKQY
jgi:putative FmdB family regulatory protein